MLVHVGRKTKLAGQQHCSAGRVVEEDRGAVAAVVRFALFGTPVPVAVAEVECGGAQNEPVRGEQRHVANDDVGVGREVTAGLVEVSAAAGVGGVYAGG